MQLSAIVPAEFALANLTLYQASLSGQLIYFELGISKRAWIYVYICIVDTSCIRSDVYHGIQGMFILFDAYWCCREAAFTQYAELMLYRYTE